MRIVLDEVLLKYTLFILLLVSGLDAGKHAFAHMTRFISMYRA